MIRRRLFSFAKRPPWTSYLVAYLLIGMGVVLVDVSAGPGGLIVIKSLGVTAFLVGFFVFATALIYSVCFVLRLGGAPPSKDACPRCGYNLTGNTSSVCPECGTPISSKPAGIA